MDWDSFDEEGAREDMGMRKCLACGEWCDGDICGPACENQMQMMDDESQAQERYNQELEDERTDTTPREES